MKDSDAIQEAYEDLLKAQFTTYCANRIKELPLQQNETPEEKFLAGLKILRDAREKASKMVGS